MQDYALNNPVDLTVATKLQPNSTGSFMMSPASEPDTTVKLSTNEAKPASVSHDVQHENRLIMSVSGESNPEQKQSDNPSSSFAWPNCNMLLLLAEAAEMKQKMDQMESSSSNDVDSDSDDHSPLVIDEDACSDDDDDSKEEDSHGTVSNKRKRGSSEERTAGNHSRFRYFLDFDLFSESSLPE